MTRRTRMGALAVAVAAVFAAALPGTGAAATYTLTVTCQLNGQTVVSGYSPSAARLQLQYYDSNGNYGVGDWGLDLKPPNSPYSNPTPTDTLNGNGVASVTATITLPPTNKPNPKMVVTSAACT